MNRIATLTRDYHAIIDAYSVSIDAFETNITNRMNITLDRTTKIPAKNWDEIQLLYSLRSTVDRIRMNLGKELSKMNKSLSYNKTLSTRLIRKNDKLSLIRFLINKTQMWTDRLDTLKSGQIYTFNYKDALQRIMKRLDSLDSLIIPNKIEVAGFVKPTIRYNGDTIEHVIKKVIEETGINSQNAVLKVATEEHDKAYIAATVESYMQKMDLEMKTIFGEIEKKLLQMKPSENVEYNARIDVEEGERERDEDGEDEEREALEIRNALEVIPIDDFEMPSFNQYEESFDEDIDVNLLSGLGGVSNNVFQTFVHEFEQLKNSIAELMLEVKLDTGVNNIVATLNAINSRVNELNDKKIDTLTKLSSEENAEFHATVNIFMTNLDRRMASLEVNQDTNITKLKEFSETQENLKTVLAVIQGRVVEMMNTNSDKLDRLQATLIKDFLESSNKKIASVDNIYDQIVKMNVESKAQNFKLGMFFEDLKNATKRVETTDTVTDALNASMLKEMLEKFQSTTRDDILTLSADIITQTEGFREEALNQLQEKYNQMFITSSNALEAQVQNLSTLSAKIDASLEEFKSDKENVVLLKKQLDLMKEDMTKVQTVLEKVVTFETTVSKMAAELKTLSESIQQNFDQMETGQLDETMDSEEFTRRNDENTILQNKQLALQEELNVLQDQRTLEIRTKKELVEQREAIQKNLKELSSAVAAKLEEVAKKEHTIARLEEEKRDLLKVIKLKGKSKPNIRDEEPSSGEGPYAEQPKRMKITPKGVGKPKLNTEGFDFFTGDRNTVAPSPNINIPTFKLYPEKNSINMESDDNETL